MPKKGVCMRESVINQQVEEIFSQLLKNLKDKVPSAFFDSMFDNDSFSLKSLSNNKALFICDSESNALMLNKAYKTTISDYLNNITQSNYEVEIIDNNTYKKRKADSSDREINSSFFKNSHLSPSQTFDSFVIGESNKNAYQAALFAVEKPGITNPIFIHSKSGLGKTHLLNAIGNEVKKKNPNASVLFISSDDFISEYVKYTLGAKGSDELKNFFSSVDYLLVDDIQLFSGKTGTQDFFFNVFNLLVNNNKQIIITSDKSPSELEDLGESNIQDRLVSRFKGGLTLSILSPNKNTLVEILKMKMKNNNLESGFLSDEVCLYLANSFSKNVRVLEGAFITLLFNITANKISKENITLDYVKSVFESEEKNKSKVQHRTLYIDDLCVDKNLLHQSIGTHLYEYAKMYAKMMNCDYITLNVWEGNDNAYNFCSQLKGKLLEINQNLAKNPKLLVESPEKNGFICLIQQEPNDVEALKEKLGKPDNLIIKFC